MMAEPVPPPEPRKTLFSANWNAARERARRLRRRERPLFLALLNAVESAWPHVRALQLLHDQLRPDATGVFAQILDFVDDHVCDLFRAVTWEVAAFVPVPGGGVVGEPDFDNTDGDADQLGLFVAILRSACFDPDVPSSAASAMRQATDPLLTWYDQLEPLLKRAADAVQGGT
jgi:hypothetical protein